VGENPAPAHRPRQPENAQFGDQQAPGRRVEAAQRDRKASVHRRGQASPGPAHEGAPGLQVPSPAQAQDPIAQQQQQQQQHQRRSQQQRRDAARVRRQQQPAPSSRRAPQADQLPHVSGGDRERRSRRPGELQLPDAVLLGQPPSGPALVRQLLVRGTRQPVPEHRHAVVRSPSPVQARRPAAGRRRPVRRWQFPVAVVADGRISASGGRRHQRGGQRAPAAVATALAPAAAATAPFATAARQERRRGRGKFVLQSVLSAGRRFGQGGTVPAPSDEHFPVAFLVLQQRRRRRCRHGGRPSRTAASPQPSVGCRGRFCRPAASSPTVAAATVATATPTAFAAAATATATTATAAAAAAPGETRILVVRHGKRSDPTSS